MDLNNVPTPNPQDLIALPPATRAAVALKSEMAEALLRDLVSKSSAITNVVDKNGRDEAHRAAMSLKNARVTIKNVGEEAREDAVAFQKAVVAEVARLAAITAEEEKRLLALRDAFDEKVAAEKAERERIEAERVAGIRAKIDTIAALPVQHAAATSDQLNGVLAKLAAQPVDAIEFGEFAPEAAHAVDTAASALLNLRNVARDREQAEAERQRQLAAEREELARLRAEQEAREKAEREAAAERARLAKLESDRLEAERRAAAEEKAAMEARMAEMQRQMEAMQRAMTPAAAPVEEAKAAPVDELVQVPAISEGDAVVIGVDLAQPDADKVAIYNPLGIGVPLAIPEQLAARAPKRPDNGDILDLLMEHYHADEKTVMGWLVELVMEQGL